jgi:hypothetical protein
MRLHPRLPLVLLLLGAACSKPATPSNPDSAPLIVSRIQVDSVRVRFAQSFPVQVFARVQGVVGDGCSSLLPIEQSRSGNVVTLEIKRQRPRDAICTQIAKLFDQDIRLDGEFRTGEYTLNVNGSPSSFQVP